MTDISSCLFSWKAQQARIVVNNFPEEILAQIVSGSNSFLVVSLWKCGDKLLNHKLANCVREVKLCDETPYTTSRWPRCLSHLSKLASLSIKVRTSAYLAGSASSLLQELKTLSPSLESLELCCAEVASSHQHVDSKPGDSYLSEKSSSDDMIASETRPFQALRTFQLACDRVELAELPPAMVSAFSWNLRELVTPHVTGATADPTLSFLPRTLEILRSSLQIVDHAGSDLLFSQIPPNLTLITRIDFSGLPGGLAKLPHRVKLEELESLYLPWTYEASLACPPSVESLYFGELHSETFSVHNTTWMAQLPRNLTKLGFAEGVVLSSACLAELPKTIAHIHGLVKLPDADAPNAIQETFETPHLTVFKSFVNMPLEIFQWLPTSLQVLNIQVRNAQAAKPLSAFPPTLTSLLIKCYERGPLNLVAPLPETLTSLNLLTLELTLDRLKFLPSSLEALSFAWSSGTTNATPKDDLFERFTKLKVLEVNVWSMKRFDELPRQLKVLHILRMSDYPLIDAEKNRDYFETLPSGLETLKLVYAEQRMPINFSGRSFSTLPNLRRLIFKSRAFRGVSTNAVPTESSFESSVLRSLSRRLVKLHLRLATIETADLHFLPPRLQKAILSVASEASVVMNVVENEEGLKLWPPAFICSHALRNSLNTLRSNADKRARCYPDPRVTSSSKSSENA